MREILTDWVTPGTSSAVTVQYWREAPVTAFDQREAWHDFLEAIRSRLGTPVVATVRTAGRLIDEETGALTGAWTESTPRVTTGSGGSNVVADATQGLVRWKTSTLHDGRFLQGRTFLPGIAHGSITGGNMNTLARDQIQAAADALILTGTGIGVWARPKPGTPGRWAGVGAVDVWSEMAVLRRRRG